jgi:hypothetical protein
MPRIWTDLGLAYLRFSDENSNPRSLDQQLLNVLNRARRDGVFMPWQYVLADAAVGGKQTWSNFRVRQHYGREKLVGKDVLHKTRQVVDRQTGKKKVIQVPATEWIWRDVPHLRTLSDELAQAGDRE